MVWQEIASAIGAIKDALHVAPVPQQEPAYDKIALLVKDQSSPDNGISVKAIEAFYTAAKKDEVKEVLLALITNSSKLLALYAILAAIAEYL